MKRRQTSGYTLVLVLSLMVLLGLTLITYTVLTRTEIAGSANNANATAGFYAAEAAMNARGEALRSKFIGYQTPTGTSTTDNCTTTQGSGDFQCKQITLNTHNTVSYVKPGNSTNITIPVGQTFAGLSAQETTYDAFGVTKNPAGNPEAITQLTFHSRLVPLFQFAVFFNKDLEFSNTATLNLAGPVHANGNVFLDSGSGASLTIQGQVTSSGTIYRGQKALNVCQGTVNVYDATNTSRTMACSPSATLRNANTTTTLSPWGGTIKQGLTPLVVPSVSSLQPVAGSLYWDQADLRVVLRPTTVAPGWAPEVQDASGNTDSVRTNILNTCRNSSPNTAKVTLNFQDNREKQYWDSLSPPVTSKSQKILLDIDMSLLLNCIRINSAAMNIPSLNDGTVNSTRGLALYFTVKDYASPSTSQGGTPTSPLPNNYGVRISNGASLHASSGSSRADLGVTVVTDQALYVQGDYNNTNQVPAALMSDTINVLSNNWSKNLSCKQRDTSGNGINSYWNGTNWISNPSFISNPSTIPTLTGDQRSILPMSCRWAGATTIKAAILAGTTTSGGLGIAEGGFDTGSSTQSGGVHNMMRFHEDWGGNSSPVVGAQQFTYQGSLVSLNQPLHSVGNFVLGTYSEGYYNNVVYPVGYNNYVTSTSTNQIYTPPIRVWSFDTSFQNAANLPPLTPRFVYLVQDNFVRKFEQ
ncbi:hypothetical protein MF271_18160 (plasmid) [Deinococcus sp. KNUC1210]|uniref:hypothetical protein n=1 Tax=Deinococcus sp. KNUC1210 TaxID=2917691 RepID=UPI001EF13409|nr:hypothetical protein [Deinococcus sp. KNUC1210]ULH17282.1 hypothetical protein MF271_18160 [Deinococcus sp. KNUC1210]